MSFIREEYSRFKTFLFSLDKKVLIVFLSVAVLQTISWYYTSRYFFRQNFYYSYFESDSLAPLYEFFYWFFGDFLVFLIIPVLIILFIHKEKPSEYGLKLGDKTTGFRYTIIFLGFMFPLIYIVSSMPAFAQNYPLLSLTKDDWTIFIVYEIGMMCYLFAWEFIWRGYTLFGLEKKFGNYAVLIQMIPFVILHNGKPDLETFSSILGGIALGFLALRTGTFIYGFIIHFGIMLAIDLISTIRYKFQYYNIFF